MGVEPTTVGRWERGETSPQPWCRPKLADALGVSLEELDTMLAEGRMERRGFLALTGTALTAPAHQWLVHEPGPLVSGLSGRRVSATLVDRLPVMITELRTMDDIAGGGTVLSLAQHEFGWVTGLLDHASYDEPTGRKLLIALAEFGQLAGWAAFDAGQPELAQRYNIVALRAAHSDLYRQLKPHVKVPAVRDFLKRARGFVTV